MSQAPTSYPALEFVAVPLTAQAPMAIEREVRALDTHERLRLRQEKARPLADSLHAWMLAQRLRATDGTGLARALDWSLKRWAALGRYIDDGQLPIDNDWVENQIRPIALGRSNWLFAGSLRAGQRAAAVMSLIPSSKLNGLDPHAVPEGCAAALADAQSSPR